MALLGVVAAPAVMVIFDVPAMGPAVVVVFVALYWIGRVLLLLLLESALVAVAPTLIVESAALLLEGGHWGAI